MSRLHEQRCLDSSCSCKLYKLHLGWAVEQETPAIGKTENRAGKGHSEDVQMFLDPFLPVLVDSLVGEMRF